jgi:hypothetical protein
VVDTLQWLDWFDLNAVTRLEGHIMLQDLRDKKIINEQRESIVVSISPNVDDFRGLEKVEPSLYRTRFRSPSLLLRVFDSQPKRSGFKSQCGQCTIIKRVTSLANYPPTLDWANGRLGQWEASHSLMRTNTNLLGIFCLWRWQKIFPLTHPFMETFTYVSEKLMVPNNLGMKKSSLTFA